MDTIARMGPRDARTPVPVAFNLTIRAIRSLQHHVQRKVKPLVEDRARIPRVLGHFLPILHLDITVWTYNTAT